MNLNTRDKEEIKKSIVENLSSQDEIFRIIIFGSFIMDENPNDMDLAIFQNSKDNYLTLSLKYRKLMREVSKKIPMDIIPIMTDKNNDFVLNEIEQGEVIFERGN